MRMIKERKSASVLGFQPIHDLPDHMVRLYVLKRRLGDSETYGSSIWVQHRLSVAWGWNAQPRR